MGKGQHARFRLPPRAVMGGRASEIGISGSEADCRDTIRSDGLVSTQNGCSTGSLRVLKAAAPLGAPPSIRQAEYHAHRMAINDPIAPFLRLEVVDAEAKGRQWHSRPRVSDQTSVAGGKIPHPSASAPCA